jgi:GntR family transcriptional regulator
MNQLLRRIHQPSLEKQGALMNASKGGRASDQFIYIDRDSETPVYAQLAEGLRQQILKGTYRPGERLPSENMLVAMSSVSPMTVRRAINLLVSQGVVTTTRGSGTFVKEVEMGSASFYLQDLKQLFSGDSATRVKLLEARFRLADERVARKLKTREGERVIFIRRLLLVGNEPAFYHRGYLINDPNRPVVEAELEVTDLRGLFQGSGSSLIKHGDLYLESTLLDDEETQVLKLKKPAVGMLLEHIFYDFRDSPISWGWFVCASTRLRLHTHVGIEHISGVRDERSR